MSDDETPPGAPEEEARNAGRAALRPSQVRAAAAAAGPPPPPTPSAWRVTFAYEGSTVRVVARRRVAMQAPPDDSEAVAAGSRGYWAEVRSADGTTLYAQVLHQPIQSDWEVHNLHGVQPRHVLPDEVRGAFEVVVPDLPGGEELVVHGRADIVDAARKAPRQLAKVRLVADQEPA